MTPSAPTEAGDSCRPKITVSGLCRRADISRQALYKDRHVRQRREVNEEAILELVRRERRLQPRLGGRKLLRLLRRELDRKSTRLNSSHYS